MKTVINKKIFARQTEHNKMHDYFIQKIETTVYSYIINFLRVSCFASVYCDVDSIVFTKLKQKSQSKLLKATFRRFDRLILSLSMLDKPAEH